jgi:hypothetical protein
VNAEPSPDKETYVEDVANWIFKRLDAGEPLATKAAETLKVKSLL